MIEVESPPKSGIMARPSGSMTFRAYLKTFWRIIFATAALVLTLGIVAFLFPQQALTIDSGEVKADALVVLGGEPGRAVSRRVFQ